MQCPKCAGKGQTLESLFGDKLPCDWCRGSGEVPDEGEVGLSVGLDAVSEFEAEIAAGELEEAIEKVKSLDDAIVLTHQELKERLEKARLSGIRQCESALLSFAVEVTVDWAKNLKKETVVAKKGEVAERANALRDASTDQRRAAVFFLYDKLREVEGWAWSMETLEAVCRHRKTEGFEGVKACLECGCILGKQEAEPKLLTASEE